MMTDAQGIHVLMRRMIGDIGFDPLGLKPEDPEELKTMQTKELQNGRVAMIAIAGFVAQELVNGKEILQNLGVGPHA